VFRAALGRPRLSGAAALAVVSASTAAVAAATGHAGAVSHVVDASAAQPDQPVQMVNAGFSEQPADAAQVAQAERMEHTHRRTAILRTFAAERIIAAERAARSAQRRALLSANPKVVAHAMLVKYGWGASQFSCLDRLWTRESKWSLTATNPSSGAYGIPQALPGTKMASAGSDWRHNPLTQISWGLSYIRLRYSSPCGAWAHSEASGWY
jgi:hypothetical protein